MPTTKFNRPRTGAEFVDQARASFLNIEIVSGSADADVIAFRFSHNGVNGRAFFWAASGFMAGELGNEPFTTSQGRDGQEWFDELLRVGFTNEPQPEAV